MSSLSAIVNYFKDCYQNDLKTISVPNFFSAKVEHRLLLDSWEPLIDHRMPFPVSTEWGQKMEEALLLHSQEKGLFCCSLFIKGQLSILGKKTKIFAPLYLHETKLIFEDEVYYIQLDLTHPIINPTFLELLKSKGIEKDISYDQLTAALPQAPFQFETIVALKTALEELFPQLEVESLDQILASEQVQTDLKQAYKSRAAQFQNQLISGAGIGLIPKSKGSRGVVNELKTMAESNDFSAVLQALFHESHTPPKQLSTREIITPFSLSQQQINIFRALDNHLITLVIGPPGTGKSFSIAALVADLISQGKSVLVASKNDQAGQVIIKKIEQDFGLKGIIVKATKEQHKNRLATRLNNILSGFSSASVSTSRIKQYELELNKLSAEIEQLEKILIQREEEELKWGAFFYQYKHSFFDRFKKHWIQYKINKKEALWSIKATIDKKRKAYVKLIKRHKKAVYNQRLYRSLKKYRIEFYWLMQGLKANSGSLTKNQFDKANFGIILEALPAWICTTIDIHHVLNANSCGSTHKT